MATSSSLTTLSNLRTKIVPRTNLWYGRYDHCLNFFLDEASCLRGLNHSHIDNILTIRSSWGRKMVSPTPGSWKGAWQPIKITDDMRAALHDICDRLASDPRDYKITIFGDWVYLYGLGRAVIDDIAQLDYLDPTRMVLNRTQLIGQPGTICVKNPKHAWRSYFRYLVQTPEQAQRLRDFLSGQSGIRLGPALKCWVNDYNWKNLIDYYFFDHDDQYILTMLALINPRLIRKTLPIVAAK